VSLQITLLRHGRPEKSLPNHRLHCLSEDGHLQAKECRVTLGNPTFDLVVHSELLRTRETARDVAGLDESATTIAIPDLFYLDEDPRGQVLEQVFKKLGHTPLHEYYKDARAELESLAQDAHRAILEEINRSNATNILVVGHGMLLQSICIAFTGENEPFMSRVLGECEGYRLTFEDGRVTSVETLG
jgi:broad specificity phosphatase PhoE